VRSVVARFVPAAQRGHQIMGWVDQLASYLVSGAVSSLSYAAVLYLPPVSLPGVSAGCRRAARHVPGRGARPDTRRRFRLRLGTAWGVSPGNVAFGHDVRATSKMWLPSSVSSFTRRHGDRVADAGGAGRGAAARDASRLLQNGLYALDDPRTSPGWASSAFVLFAIGVAVPLTA
jgi:hypothetical protein